MKMDSHGSLLGFTYIYRIFKKAELLGNNFAADAQIKLS